MTVSNPRTSGLTDPAVPGVSVLLEDRIPAPLGAVAAELGGDLRSAEAIQATWWPGRGITVRYRAKFEGGKIPGEHQLVAVAGDIPDGAMIVESTGGARIGVWRVPFDPQLPGLASALDPGTTGALLDDLGIDPGKVKTRLRAYRPGKRAVVEVARPGGSVFLKIVPPNEVQRLHRIHQLMVEHLPVPQSLGYSPDLGIIALQTLPGTTLRDRLTSRGPLPSPAALDALLAALPKPDKQWKSTSPIVRLPRLTRLLTTLLPEEAGMIDELVDAIGNDPLKPDQSVHGDFYEAQVMVAKNQVTGLLDFDTFGWGRAPDDPATMIGHLAVLASGHNDARLRGFAAEVLKRADQRHDPADLRRRAAAVIISLATGPFRVQRANWPEATASRLALAARWVESADRVNKSSLTLASGSSHPPVAS